MLLVAWVAAGLTWVIQSGGGAAYAVPAPSGSPLSSALGKEQNSATQPGRDNPAVEARLVAAYGKLPLSFEANSGQADNSVRFLSHGRGYTVSLTGTEADVCFGAPERCGTRSAVKDNEAALHETARSGGAPAGTLVRMKLAGANREPEVSGLDRLPGTANYFIGSDPRNWHTRVATYAKVRYKNVYPGIDLIYYGNQRQLEYDFVVVPGADPKKIVLGFKGADKLEIDAQGELVLHTTGGDIRQHKPVIYQDIDGVRREAGRNGLISLRTTDVVLVLKSLSLIPAVRPVLDLMRQRRFGIDPPLYERTLRAANEWPLP